MANTRLAAQHHAGKQQIIDPDSATRLNQPAGSPPSNPLTLLFELLFLMWSLLTFKDWLWSQANPFPYSAALGTLFCVVIPMGLALNFAPIFRWARSALGEKAHPNWTRKFEFGLSILVIALVVGIVLSIVHCLYPVPKISNMDDAWLGSGLGTASKSGQSFGEVLVAEQGWVTIIVLLSLIAVSLGFCLLAAFDAMRRLPRTRQSFEIVSLLIALCMIGVVMLSPFGTYPFMTVDSVTGTWILALALAWIGGLQSYSAGGTLKRNLQQRNGRSRRFWLIRGGIVLLCIGIAGQVIFSNAAHPYVGSATPQQFRDYIQLTAIAPVMQDATIAMEDPNFYTHHGFDWIALHRVLRTDVREGRLHKGSSTITQQLARDLFLKNDRTVWGTLKATVFTCALEWKLPKTRILELHLNTIDYGMGQHGIGAAARYYFHETPDKLTLAESAVLVAIASDPANCQADSQPLQDARQTALDRIRELFPERYMQAQTDLASWYPLSTLMYPDKAQWDRGVKYQILAGGASKGNLPRRTVPRSIQDPPAKSIQDTMAEISGAPHLPRLLRLWLSKPVTRQTTGHSCGEASVATVLTNYLNKPTTEAQIMHFLKSENSSGTSSDDLISAFKAQARLVVPMIETQDELLSRIERTGKPAIAFLSRPGGHWIVVVGEWGDYLVVFDPPQGNVLMPKNEFIARSYGESDTLEIK